MPTFQPVPAKPDHVALEHSTLARWESERTFETLRDRNRGNEPFSFIDGPITANNPMGVHHGWGRTLKDIWQRYAAMRGCDLLYQNGFDCQGLWVEVGVEKELGLNSKREIEEYGLDRFSRACRDRVAHFSGDLTAQSKRLGQWMDWERSYYTMTDPNISYIWGFLKLCNERGWLYKGHRSMPWCPRCGTSLSQHELIDSYKDLTHPSLHVRLPLARPRPRVPGRVDDDALDASGERRRRRPARRRVRRASRPRGDRDRRRVAPGGEPDRGARARHGARLGARRAHLHGAVRRAPRPAGVRKPGRALGRRVDGGGHRHRPHRPRLRRGGLRARKARGARAAHPGRRGRRLRRRVRLAARPRDGRGRPDDRRRPGPAGPARRRRRDHAPLPRLLALRHRAHLPAGGRVVHRLRRDAPADDRRRPRGGVDAAAVREADGGLAAQHGRLVHQPQALLGPAAAVLLLRGRPPDRGRVEGGALRAGRAGHRGARRAAPAVDRRRRHPLRPVRRGRAPGGRRRRRLARRRDRPVLDARLAQRGVRRGGLRRGRRRRGDGRRPARPRALGEVVPGRLGVGDARADPALVLLDALHGGHAGRPLAVPAGAHLREGERRDGPAHAQVVGERHLVRGRDRGDGRRRHALDVRRPAAGPEPELRLRAGGRREEAAAHAVEHVRLLRHLRRHQRLPARALDARRRPEPGGDAAARPLGGRPHPGPRAGVPRRARHLRLAAARPRLRGPRRRPLELVRAALALAVLEVRRRGVDARRPRDAVVCARPGGAVRRAGDAVPGGRDVAEPRARPVRRRRAERPPGRLSRADRLPSTTRAWSRRSIRCGRSSSSAAGRARRRT